MSTQRSRRDAFRISVLTFALATVAGGCQGSQRRTIGFGAADGEHVAVYLYDYSAKPDDVRHTTITDRRQIYDLVQIAYRDVVTGVDVFHLAWIRRAGFWSVSSAALRLIGWSVWVAGVGELPVCPALPLRSCSSG